MKYNWQKPEWPEFAYNQTEIECASRMFDVQLECVRAVLRSFDIATEDGKRLDAMVAEAVSTSAIEGERLDPQDVMSSMKNRLGQNTKPIPVRDYRASGVAAMLLDLRDEGASPLSEAMLFDWHRLLFENYPVRELPEITGGYRRDCIFVKSANMDADTVRFEAPPAKDVPREMKRFVDWFNATGKSGMPSSVRSAIAHLYFESIHPFCDGNGRLGRALVSKVVAQDSGSFVMIPFSVGLLEHRARYYDALHEASFLLDVTLWIRDFTELLIDSIKNYGAELQFQIRVMCLLSGVRHSLNGRQIKVFERMAREGARGFVGGMSAGKYKKIAATSKATATRDLTDMLDLGILQRTGMGTAVRYQIAS
jgi:Fic family protein